MASEPTLTPSEKGLLTTVTNRVRAAQDAALLVTGRCVQGRRDADAELVACGMTLTQVNSSRTAGFDIDIDEYDGPLGRGWQLRVMVVRDGLTWGRVIPSGPETWREQPWHVVPEMV